MDNDIKKNKQGRPKSDSTKALQARAWFNFVAKVNAGAVEIGQAVEPVSAMRLCEVTSGGENRTAYRWEDGRSCPLKKNCRDVYTGLKLTAPQIAAANMVLSTGPDGFPLWDILRGKLGKAGDFPLNQTEYFQNTFHIYQELIGKLQEWLQVNNAISALPLYIQPAARTKHHSVAIDRGMVLAITKQLKWYGLEWEEVLVILREKIPVFVQADNTEDELNDAMDKLDASQSNFD